jgi:glucose 1-dehydrogenase
MELMGKVALITGGNRGIGRGCALELARLGADIVIADCQPESGVSPVVDEVAALGRRAIYVRGDVSERSNVEAMVSEAVRGFGRLDIAIANAARSVRRPFLELSEDDFRQTLDVTLMGVFHTIQLAARHLVKQGEGGSIVIISSVLAELPMPTSAAYNSAKAGINQMGRTAATELAKHRIRVNVIEPGYTDTPGERAFASEEELASIGPTLPLGRLGSIEDISYGAAFLSGPRAAYITGSVLRIDGGYMLPRVNAQGRAE